MATTNKELAQALESLIETTPQSKLAQLIAAYLIDNRATKDLEAIMREVERLRAEKGIVEATLVSAYPLTERVKAESKKLIQKQHPAAKAIVLNENVDPSVLGGLRIETGQTQFDTTIKAKLHKLERANV